MTENTTTPKQPRRLMRSIENFVVIWLDSDINAMNDSIHQLHRSLYSSIRTFNEPNTCVDFITDVKDQKIFLILSTAFGEILVPLIHDVFELESIYIFGENMTRHEEWSKKWKKVKGIYTNIVLIGDQLKQNAQQCEHDLTSINILPSFSTKSLNELDPSFMYTQLLKEILLGLNYDDKKKKELIDFCHFLYSDNDFAQNIIDAFEESYPHHSPIWWYTKESFIYSTLNRALRTQDITVIIKMGFFIRDLHQQIEQLHAVMQRTKTVIVYRGQGMSKIDFDKMMKSKGGLLSFNNFLSTSSDQQVSRAFAESSRENSELIGILFRIEVDPSISTCPFASLDNVSYYSDSEQEILFSMHTVFRIDEINNIEEKLWQINLTLTNDSDDQLKHLTEQMRMETRGQRGWYRLGILMCKMGELDKAEEVYNTLLETVSESDRADVSVIHHHLGYIYGQKGDLTNSLVQYNRYVDSALTGLSGDDPQLSATYTGIGLTLKRSGDFSGALNHYQRALDIELRARRPNYLNIVSITNNIGGLLDDQSKQNEALKYLTCALVFCNVHLPSRHPSLGTTNNNIGLVYYSKRQFLVAIAYYQKALEIRQKSLPPNHLSLAMLHHNMAMTFADFHRYEEAIKHVSIAINISSHTFSLDHPQIQTFQNDLDIIISEWHSTSSS